MKDSPYLFVYGSLRPETQTPWARTLASKAKLVGIGVASGDLFQLNGYPGMVATADWQNTVTGEVFRLRDTKTWRLLDDYEGCGPGDPLPHEFERTVLPIRMQDGDVISAWVYVYSLDPSGRQRILSGDYLRI